MNNKTAWGSEKIMKFETKLIHSGELRLNGSVVTPLFQTAMFEYRGETDYNAMRYIRLNNTPNHIALHEKLAALEGAESALVTSSGMAAISTALFALLDAGDHLLTQRYLYGGMHDLLIKDFPAFGLTYSFFDGDDPDAWEKELRPTTKVIYVEPMYNPLLQVPNLEAVVAFARKHNLIAVVDNTFATPVNFRPAELGFDLSLHSATKYLNGHSDILAGAVIGRADLVEKVRLKVNRFGGSLDPHAAFLLHRGLKTLQLRVQQQNQSALAIARFLEAHPAVSKVHYPGLESHPQHARARKLFDGYGGMISFELAGGVAAADTFMKNVKIPLIVGSLGGVETLLTRPATTSFVSMKREDRESIGISDALVRVSVGIESLDDLLADFAQALEVATPIDAAPMVQAAAS